MQFEECHIPGQNTFLNPHFYSAWILKAPQAYLGASMVTIEPDMLTLELCLHTLGLTLEL
jgi:hypothetical protein